MKAFPLSTARRQLARLVCDVSSSGKSISITKDGKPVAVLVSASTYDGWRTAKGYRAVNTLMRDIGSGLVELKSGKSKLYTLEELVG